MRRKPATSKQHYKACRSPAKQRSIESHRRFTLALKLVSLSTAEKKTTTTTTLSSKTLRVYSYFPHHYIFIVFDMTTCPTTLLGLKP